MKPRIFVSAVTREFGVARQLVANTLIAMGYEPVWQDIFSTSADDIRPMLRQKIDTCGAVLQIVGDAYGAEPPQPDETFGRCSYTQYEALYAAAQGKKVYYLIAQDDMPRDADPATIDVPLDDSAEALADLQERLRLQNEYRDRCRTTEHIFYLVQNHPETELTIRRLKDELERLRRGFKTWMAGVAVALVLIGAGVVWLTRGQQDQGLKLDQTRESVAQTTEELRQLAARLDDPDQLRAMLTKTIQETYDKAMAEAETLPGWRERDQAKGLAISQRDQNLSRVDEWLDSILAEIRSGNASPEYLEMLRIAQEEGPQEALDYILSRKEALLARFDRESQSNRERNLLPLLEAVRQQVRVGDYTTARILCDELLTADPIWGDALHEQF